MKIWVHLNGQQQGPYEFDQLKGLPITPQTPVWYEGLAQWTVAAVAPATAILFQPQQPPQPADTSTQPQQPTQPQAAPQQSTQPVNQPAPQPQWQWQPQAPTQPQLKRPATYIVWSVLLMILCCSPFALAALIFGVLSSSRYDAGDYGGAKAMSTAAAWMIIISIALSLFTSMFGFGLFTGCI